MISRDTLVKKLLEEAHYWVSGVEPLTENMPTVQAIRDAKAETYIDAAGLALGNTDPRPTLSAALGVALDGQTPGSVSRDVFVAALTAYLTSR